MPRIEKEGTWARRICGLDATRLPGDDPASKQWLSEIVSAAPNPMVRAPQRPERSQSGGGNRNQMIAFMFRLMRDQSNTSMGRR